MHVDEVSSLLPLSETVEAILGVDQVILRTLLDPGEREVLHSLILTTDKYSTNS